MLQRRSGVRASQTSGNVLCFRGSPSRSFSNNHSVLNRLFDSWKYAGVVTVGSGRPVNVMVSGDANQDGNSENDRLPGARRNSFLGPDYASTDLRITRVLIARERFKLEFVAESFNLLNRNNKRVAITDQGLQSDTVQFLESTHPKDWISLLSRPIPRAQQSNSHHQCLRTAAGAIRAEAGILSGEI